MSSQIKSKNITWHHGKLTSEERQENWAKKEPSFGSRAFPLSGKSTVAREVELALIENNINAYVLDGDNIRHGLTPTSASRRTTEKKTSAESAKWPSSLLRRTWWP